ncbi:hypothetical protein BCR44DRAFT_1438736, partial [Catenaria anguillulae PL171]
RRTWRPPRRPPSRPSSRLCPGHSSTVSTRLRPTGRPQRPPSHHRPSREPRPRLPHRWASSLDLTCPLGHRLPLPRP